jgi:hypothetical protein
MVIEWDLSVDVADNGSMCVLKCLKCREKWARVFLESEDIWVDINLWKKGIIDEHLFKHQVVK